MPTRREFLKQAAAVTTLAMAGLDCMVEQTGTTPSKQPWYRTASRWGQTNITEADCTNYDIPWWRQHWKRTRVQGVIINAGGIFAYYPSKFPLHYRPPQLAGRDLYGELAKAAHDEGIAVVARMDSSKGHEPLYRAHPEFFARTASGAPYRSGEFYLTCINTPYYTEYLPGIFREIIERTKPEGIADNIWSGMERTQPCYCEFCTRKFMDLTGKPIPTERNWDDPTWQQWNEWNFKLRNDQWDFNNQVTKEAGGPDCLWIGMNASGVAGLSGSFRDMTDLCSRAEMILLDQQSRTDTSGFGENAQSGKHMHSLLGWDKIVPESMAMYQHGRPQYRVSAKSAPEVRLWMLSGFAGGIGPWWHHVGAYDEDRRPYKTAEPVMEFHEKNERFLNNRKPVATVAVGWSRQNADYFGRENSEQLVAQPWRGFTQALTRARIPWVPMHLSHLERDGADISVLVLPNVGALSDAQIASIRAFVQRGGSVVATGQSTLYNELGVPRSDFALADLFGVKGGKPIPNNGGGALAREAGGGGFGGGAEQHTYLRLTPEIGAAAYGPKRGDEPAISGTRHPVLAGFDETDILPFGGTLAVLEVTSGATALATFIPSFPSTPPEIVWMHTPRTSIPGVVVNDSQPGRVVYFAADLDRKFAVDNFPDHGDLLANAVRWAARDTIPLSVTGPGSLNCELYRQDKRLILHVLNFTNAGTWRAPVDELIPVGPLEVAVRSDARPLSVSAMVAGAGMRAAYDSGWVKFIVPSVLDHELIVIEA
jgi:hypothetical protein